MHDQYPLVKYPAYYKTEIVKIVCTALLEDYDAQGDISSNKEQ